MKLFNIHKHITEFVPVVDVQVSLQDSFCSFFPQLNNYGPPPLSHLMIPPFPFPLQKCETKLSQKMHNVLKRKQNSILRFLRTFLMNAVFILFEFLGLRGFFSYKKFLEYFFSANWIKVRTRFRKTIQYLMRTIWPLVKNPNASEASHRPKQQKNEATVRKIKWKWKFDSEIGPCPH